MSYTREEIEEAGLSDFRLFVCEVWAFLGLPRPTATQLDIAHCLQHAVRRFMVQAFRGVGKSFITVAFVLWQLFLNPQLKIMVVSANQTLADNFSTFCKQLIHGMPLLQHLAPRQGQRDSNVSFDVGPATPDKDPSVKSVGITGQLTGSRADIIVVDDIEVPKNSYTHLLRERLAELIKEFDAVLKPGGRIIYLGTPQNEQSIYNRLPERGYTISVWPAEIPQNPDVYHGRLAVYVLRKIEKGAQSGSPLDPQRFDYEDLAERKASYGRSGYALQFMLDTSLSDVDKHPLKLKDLIVHDVDPEMGHVKLVWGSGREQIIQDLHAGGFEGDAYMRPVFRAEEMAKYTGTVMSVDPAGRGKDETAYAIIKFLYGQLYLVDVGGYRDGFSEDTLKALAAKAARWGVNYTIVEENYGGGMFNELLKPHLARVKAGGIDDEWNGWSRGQKELRILDTLEPIVQSHRLTVSRRVLEEDSEVQGDTPQYSFVHQFTRISRVRGALQNDDRLEAVAMACAYWTERMARDQDAAHQAHKDELKLADLRRFQEHVFGHTSKPLRYQASKHR